MIEAPMIEIRDLRVTAFIGVPDEERANAQELRISVKFPALQAEQAARLDDIKGTVDYFTAYEVIKKITAERPRKLIERLALDIAEELLKRLDIPSVEIQVKKFIFPDAEYVSFTLTRLKNGTGRK